MASNPMQRKARNSFLLGMLLMLVITGLIIGLLFIQLKNYQDKEAESIKSMVNIAILNTDVKSGQIITSDMLTTKSIDRNLIPENAIGDVGTLENYSLQDKEGNSITTKSDNGLVKLYLNKDGRDNELKQEDTGSYYIEKNGDKEYVELNNIPVIAKITMSKNTVLTRETISKGNNTTSDDVRRQEYNVVILPTQLQTGDYVDIRLSMPSGQDYIVISKKEVEIPVVDGGDSEDTIWLKLSEDEILTMNSAIVDAFKVPGTKLYATTYTEPGIQQAATPTYSISREVFQLMVDNPNIVERAKNELAARYNNGQRDVVNNAIQDNINEGASNLNTKVQESITKLQDERKQYLDSLNSGTTAQ